MTARHRRVLLVVFVCAAAAACGVGPEQQARPLPVVIGPGAFAVPPSVLPTPAGSSRERLFFVRGASLEPVVRRVTATGVPTALRDLLVGPSPGEQAQGLTSALPVGIAASVRLDGGLAVVSLGGDLSASGRSDGVVALAQVVATLDASPGVRAVRFEQDGEALAVPRSDGSLTRAPVTAADYADLTASPSPTPSPSGAGS